MKKDYEKLTIEQIEELIEELENLKSQKFIMESIKKFAKKNPDKMNKLIDNHNKSTERL